MYKEAQKRLDENKIVIITGHPGEGKSCMAKQLLLTRFAADRCLNITHSTDWDHVNLYAKQPDAILIDDIFGVRAFDKGLFDYWEKKLTDLLRAVKKYNIYVILTSRHYILEESKVLVKTVPPFDQKENFILLSSNELMDDEKVQILESHLKAEERRINKDSVKNCIVNHADFQRTLFRKHRFKFGFPQCAALYSRRDDLFNERGENFFINPNTFFKQCIEQLSEHEQNFLALILLWVIPKQELHRSKINDYLTSEEIKLISKELHFEMNGDLVRSLRKSLESHIGGVLHFSNETGIFTFSHSVISDMIGLVTAKQKTEFVVKHGATEFLFNFLAFEGDEDEYEFHVPAYLYDERLQTIKQLKEKIKQLKEKIEKPGQELGKLKQDIEKLDQEREKLDQEREKLDQDKEKLDQKRKKLDQDKKKLDQEREKLDQEREKLELEIEKQTLELIKILQEIDKMEQKRVQMKKMSQFDLKQMRNRRVKLK